VTSVFISSLARGEMATFRRAARDAIDSLGMRPVMFETEPPSAQDSRRALLDRIPQCDALLLILGAEYGEPAARGASPTEEEFQEAVHHGVPVLAIVQDGVEREAAQKEFINRVRGTWEEGRFAPAFRDRDDVMRTAVRALNEWRQRGPNEQLRAAAEQIALYLATGDDRPGTMSSSGSLMSVVLVPLVVEALLDPLALEDPTLADDLAGAARASGLVSNAMGIETEIDREDTVHLRARQERGWESPHVCVTRTGAILVEGAVGAQRGNFASSQVVADRVVEVISRGAAFAERVWSRIDRRDEVRQVLALVAVPGAQEKVYAPRELTGNTLQMGHSFSIPNLLIAPEPPLLLRREDLASADVANRLRATLRRRFAAEGGVQEE
jgi:Domain of unknown function (DUF4062)